VFCLFLGSPAHAAEVQGPIHKGGDWTAEDRAAWMDASQSLSGATFQKWYLDHAKSNTFYRASLGNTRENRPLEYSTVFQRQAYYDALSAAIEYGPDTPPAIRGVRFFHATATITSRGLLGYVETHSAQSATPVFGLPAATIALVKDLNAQLFAVNVGVLKKLFYVWKQPRAPRLSNPEKPMAPLDFDLQMVELEQQTVQDSLSKTSTSAAAVDGLNQALGKAQFLNVGMRGWAKWAADAGHTKSDFRDIQWRKAIGRAVVFQFHGKSESEYLDYMARQSPRDAAAAEAPDRLNPPDPATPGDREFTVLGSWQSPAGAMRQLTELRRKDAALQVEVFPPASGSKYWRVVSATYADSATARQAVRDARRAHLANDAYAYRLPAAKAGASELAAYAPSVKLGTLPPLQGSRPDQIATTSANRLVTLGRYATLSEAQAQLDALRLRFPEVPMQLFQGPPDAQRYAIVLASFVTEEGERDARAIARRMGIPSSSVEATVLTQASLAQWQAVAGGKLEGVTHAAEVVTKCFKAGNVTVGQLHGCSHYWVTSRILAACILQSDCQVLPDQIDVDGFLKAQGLTLNSPLSIDTKDFPLPVDTAGLDRLRSSLQSCLNADRGREDQFRTCIAPVLDLPQFKPAKDCMAAANNDLQGCFVKLVGVDSAAIGCMVRKVHDPTAAVACVGVKESDQLRDLQVCIQSERSAGDIAKNCMVSMLPKQAQAATECLAKAGDGAGSLSECVSKFDPKAGKMVQAASCLEAAKDDQARLRCAGPLLGGDAGRIVTCYKGGDVATEQMLSCAMAGKPGVAGVASAVACVQGAKDALSAVASCGAGHLDPKVVAVASCASQASGDTTKLASCAAVSFVPEEYRGLATCATTSQSVVGFGLCAAGPRMNAEWRMAAECAATSGGVPVTFAACTGGRLTIAELTKCFTGKIGGTDGCFGENNTLVKAFTDVGRGLDHLGGQIAQVGDKTVREMGNAIHDIGGAIAQLATTPGNAIQNFFQQRGNDLHNAAHWVVCATGIGC
jgi:hypothetical protein